MFPWESPEFVFPFLWLTWGRFSIQSWRLSLHILSSAQAVEIRSFPLVFHLQMDFGAAGVGEQLPPPSVGDLRGVPEGVRASEGPFPPAGTEPKLWILPAGIAPGAGLDGPALPLPRCQLSPSHPRWNPAFPALRGLGSTRTVLTWEFSFSCLLFLFCFVFLWGTARRDEASRGG